jgi:uncharacterized protein (TIGR02266 family)
MATGNELAAVFDRAAGERLLAAERFVLLLPGLFGAALVECDLAYARATASVFVIARLSPRAAGPEAQARFRFWCARTGGRLASVSPQDLPAFLAQLECCDLRERGLAPDELSATGGAFFGRAGAPPTRRRDAAPHAVLSIDLGSSSSTGMVYDAVPRLLFLPGALAPPVGDELTLAVRVPGAERPTRVRARVTEVRPPGAAAGGAPAGYTLALLGPPEVLCAALERSAPQDDDPTHCRVHPRYAVKAPVKVSAPAAPAAAATTARIEYATDQELVNDYVDNLSQGGAFVRTDAPAPIGTRLSLDMRLPGGVELHAPATVVFSKPGGMGVKFELDAENDALLASVIVRISARPRRAVVVDDDALVRQMLSDTLRDRGFEVLSARDGAEGLQVVSEELLTLDLLITDLKMPHMDGERFVQTIRLAGGESDLAIVVVTGNLEPGAEKRLTAAGADAVLEKSLGPELIAQAADAVVERRRLKG